MDNSNNSKSPLVPKIIIIVMDQFLVTLHVKISILILHIMIQILSMPQVIMQYLIIQIINLEHISIKTPNWGFIIYK